MGEHLFINCDFFSAGTRIERFECCNGYLVCLCVLLKLILRSRLSLVFRKGVNFSLRLFIYYVSSMIEGRTKRTEAIGYLTYSNLLYNSLHGIKKKQ